MAGNLIARWLFENNLNDSSGNGLNLTGYNSPTYNATDKKEGSYSLNVVRASTQGAYINDANLPSNFPWKNGTGNLSGSIALWVKSNSTSYNSYVALGKGTANNIYCYNGFTSIVFSRPGVGFAQTIGHWYFIAVSYDNATGQQYTYVWNDTTQTVVLDSLIAGVTYGVNSSIFSIGIDYNKTNAWDGLIDAVSIYDGPLNREELIALRTSFTPPGAKLITTHIHAQVEYTPPAANDFANDDTCKAWWKLNTGALTTDSKSTNTLTNVNTVGENSTYYKSGTVSGQFDNASHRYLAITDANKSATFPFKTGDTHKQVTMMAWFRMSTSSGWRIVLGQSKYATSGRQAFALGLNGTNISLLHGAASGGGFDIGTGKNVTLNQWYHGALVADGITGTCRIRVWDDVAGTVTNYNLQVGSQYLPIAAGGDDFRIGAFADQNANYTWDGQIDEALVFNRLLSDAEIDNIRLNTYASITVTEPHVLIDQALAQVEYEEDPRIITDQALAQVEYEFSTNSGNDYSTSPAVKALWRMEKGASTVDSKNANTLSQIGVVTEDMSVFKEGAAAAAFNGSSALTIADANLISGFPLKSGGSSPSRGTYCFWFNQHPDNSGADKWLISKATGWLNEHSFAFDFYSSQMYLFTTANGTTQQTALSNVYTITRGRWYHLTFTYDNTNGTFKVWLWDSIQNTFVYMIDKAIPGGSIYVGAGPLTIGGIGSGGGWYGWVDEVIALNRGITAQEIRQIISFGYSTPHTPAYPGNNFGGDSRFKARWQFEDSPGFTADSISTNTLVKQGTQVPFPDAAYAALDGWTGSRHPNSSYFTIDDANLSAGFPLKTGDINKKITIGGWITPTDIGSGAYFRWLWSKGQGSFNGCGAAISSDGNFYVKLYQNGYQMCPANTIVPWKTYHVMFVIDGVAKTCHIRLYDKEANTTTNYDYTFSDAIVVGNVAFYLGGSTLSSAWTPFYGWMDDWIVAADTISDSDIDKIRNYSFGGDPPDKMTSATHCQDVPYGPPYNAVSATIMGSPPVIPPENSVSLTICEDTQYPPDTAYSDTTCEDIPSGPPHAVSLTIVESLIIPPPADCISLTTCQVPAKGGPANAKSNTLCQTIPLNFGEGLFTVF